MPRRAFGSKGSGTSDGTAGVRGAGSAGRVRAARTVAAPASVPRASRRVTDMFVLLCLLSSYVGFLRSDDAIRPLPIDDRPRPAGHRVPGDLGRPRPGAPGTGTPASVRRGGRSSGTPGGRSRSFVQVVVLVVLGPL